MLYVFGKLRLLGFAWLSSVPQYLAPGILFEIKQSSYTWHAGLQKPVMQAKQEILIFVFTRAFVNMGDFALAARSVILI